MTPPELAQPLYELVSQITGNEDPYRAIKKSTSIRPLNFILSSKS